MSELDRLFGPAYRASPGSVYPALTALVEEELILEERDGPRRRYRCSPTGRAALAKRKAALAAIEVRTGIRLRSERELAAVIDRFAARVEQLRGRIEPDDLETMLDDVATRLDTAARSRRSTSDR
jgi:DNA-binding PadR family transcriptional regulator